MAFQILLPVSYIPTHWDSEGTSIFLESAEKNPYAVKAVFRAVSDFKQVKKSGQGSAFPLFASIMQKE
jgi:hypothetical protein